MTVASDIWPGDIITGVTFVYMNGDPRESPMDGRSVGFKSELPWFVVARYETDTRYNNGDLVRYHCFMLLGAAGVRYGFVKLGREDYCSYVRMNQR